MKRSKRDMMVVMGMCGRYRQPYGVTVEKHRGSCDLLWSFKISHDSAKREGFESNSFHGAVRTMPEFPGCPYCGSQGWYICCHCGNMACSQPGETYVTCPHCGKGSNLYVADEFDLKGGER